MVASMTGYARESSEAAWGAATWEVRSVNHRFLDVSIRLPEDLRALESAARERVSARLSRGKVDCSLRLDSRPGAAQGLAINDSLLAELLRAMRSVESQLGPASEPSALELLRWPGVLETDTLDADALREPLLGALDSALATLAGMREREGGVLAAGLDERCSGALALLGRLRERVPEIVAEQIAKLRQRIEDLDIDADPGRLEQELALMANRMDVAEEMDRLEAHLEETRRTLSKTEPVGRRLDFLLQEMNREANTIGSKSSHIDSTNAAIELKVMIEQMREQVQNIE